MKTTLSATRVAANRGSAWACSRAARAIALGRDKPIRLRVTERFSPIGAIVGSLPGTGEAMVDGPSRSGEQPDLGW